MVAVVLGELAESVSVRVDDVDVVDARGTGEEGEAAAVG